tara:strand:- start:162 stop:485 length:324 start_codon:yes stop_codon:yes gene_type:complete
MSYRTDREENLFMLATRYCKSNFPIARRLQYLGRALHRSYENECNYGLTPLQERRERRLWAEVEDIAQEYGFYVKEQGDPRGWPIIIGTEPLTEDGRNDRDRVCPWR